MRFQLAQPSGKGDVQSFGGTGSKLDITFTLSGILITVSINAATCCEAV